MASELGSLYNESFKLYKLLHESRTGQQAQKEFNVLWAKAKAENPTKNEFVKFARNLLADYRKKNSAKKAASILFYFSKQNEQSDGKNIASSSTTTTTNIVVNSCAPNSSTNIVSQASGTHEPEVNELGSRSLLLQDSDDDIDKEVIMSSTSPIPSGTRKRKVRVLESDEEAIDDPGSSSTLVKRVRATPAQDELKKRISLLEAELEVAIRRRDCMSSDNSEQRQILKLKKNIESSKKELHKKWQHTLHAKKHRNTHRSKINAVCIQNPDAANILKLRTEPGRPRLEEKQPELLKTIVDLAMFGASAEERRRCEIVRSCRTLGDLHGRLVELGFQISRSGTYIRLLPRRYTTLEGKRHVVTVPVKLSRPEADHHKAHPDQHFCTATVRSLETVASILGPHQVSFISQDDKARVPIGLTAANKQAPLLMHVEYRVSLPDHDWVVAAKHKLIPSVYAGCIIKGNAMGRPEAVTYTGPTYISIRSGKHSSSTASSHATDFDKLATLDSFKEIMREENGDMKPVFMISSDGGPDENPRYPKVVANAIHHFQQYGLDAIFVFTNAPGRSAFNRVERRMAPLSRELSGVILPHDSFGSHLNDRGQTVDSELEKKNFRKAGEVLAEIWSSVVIDGKSVVTEYVEPDAHAESFVPVMPSQQWCSNHVRHSQYLLQVVKCDVRACCSEFRSSLHLVLPERFLPAPFPIIQTSNSLSIPTHEEHDGETFAPFLLRQSLCLVPPQGPFRQLPYDMYCPSVQSELEGRTCKECGLYFCSKKAVTAHKSSLHRKNKGIRNEQAGEQMDEEEGLHDVQEVDTLDVQELQEVENTPALVSIAQSIQNPWIEEEY